MHALLNDWPWYHRVVGTNDALKALHLHLILATHECGVNTHLWRHEAGQNTILCCNERAMDGKGRKDRVLHRDETRKTKESKMRQFLFCFVFFSRFFINGCSLNTYMCVALLKIAFMFDVDGLNSCAILIRRCPPGCYVTL